jgi:GNAT superfamily N-acetyltransferase
MACTIDPVLISAWLTARSVARNLPAPVPDRGGLRVDTYLEKEQRRWVFPRMAEGLVALAEEITEPLNFLKLCGDAAELRGRLPSRWTIQSAGYVMLGGATTAPVFPLPDGYAIASERNGPTLHVRIIAADGVLAASGYAAEVAGVFIYDRIVTEPAHRRRGLGRALMAALGEARKSPSVAQILVATEEGRRLYASLGWTVCSPYTTAEIPA